MALVATEQSGLVGHGDGFFGAGHGFREAAQWCGRFVALTPTVSAPGVTGVLTVAVLSSGSGSSTPPGAGCTVALLVMVPPAAMQGRPLPLVLALHGGGGHADFMADDERYGWRRKADRWA